MIRSLAPLLITICLLPAAHARLGETEAQLLARFGKPVMSSKHSVAAQGRMWELGPSHTFRQDDWNITCDLVDGRCARIAYGKRGDWTEEQIQLVLGSNSQGVKWTETTKGDRKLARTWKRADGGEAAWHLGLGMRMVVPAYDRAKQVIEAKAKAAASQKPKI